jgi:hypothetical protein
MAQPDWPNSYGLGIDIEAAESGRRRDESGRCINQSVAEPDANKMPRGHAGYSFDHTAVATQQAVVHLRISADEDVPLAQLSLDLVGDLV